MALFFSSIQPISAQSDTTKWAKRIETDTSKPKLNMDALYNRPFLTMGKFPVAIGGYMEANSQYENTGGVNNGLSFQMRRMTLFVSSTIAKKIKFLSEIEFESGTKEISIETAVADIELHPSVNLRGGIIVNPIGSFNQNHDGPRWDFIDRPLSATTILPATLSNVGFGVHGKYFLHNWVLGYEAYLTNGFDGKIVDNDLNRTSLHEGKENIDKFEVSSNGSPLFTGKLAVRNRRIGELGLSCMTGVYNNWKKDGIVLDNKRRVTALAVDFSTSLLKNKLAITGEICQVMVDKPDGLLPTFGSKQMGGFIDIVGTVVQHRILGWDNAKVNVGVRLDYADYNQDKFQDLNTPIADYVWAIVPCIAFRPVGTTVIRFNYRYQNRVDFVGNPAIKSGVVQFGLSTYF